VRITWLGQAGLLFDNGKTKIMVDPYLSDSVAKIEKEKTRRIPIKKVLFDTQPNVMIFTHDHLDHYDPETASIFLGEDRKPITVLSPCSVWKKVRENKGAHNYVLFDRGSQWTEGEFRFRAVKAVHSDPCAIGVIIEALDENKTYYITGDTLYNGEIFSDIKEKIDVVFLPINGVGNNMNVTDAVRFFKDCGAKKAVPYHVGMFDEQTPEIFECENKIILEIYKEREI
jgi:L-ascorbate metabolism protein UlaG (beta-lactamase superfamily)